MKIVRLSQHPEYCDEIAKHTYKMWSKEYKILMKLDNEAEWAYKLKTIYSLDGVYPMSFVAIDDNKQFLGFLVVENNSIFKGQKLWLSNIYVLPEYRNKGVAKAMINGVCEVLKTKYGVSKVYLWYYDTKMTSFYENLGFEYVDSYQYDEFNLKIMKKEIIPPSDPLIKPVHIIGLFVLILIVYFFRRKTKNVIVGNPT